MMFNAEVTSTNMQVLPLLCLCFLTGSGTTFADEHGPALKEKSCENIRGAASRPYISILYQTNGRVLLQCDVLGVSSRSEVMWMDSAGNILPANKSQVPERGGSFNITLQTTVNKTDRFRCVATQEEISHQTNAEIYVYDGDAFLKDRTCENIPGAAPKPLLTKLSRTTDWALLQCEVQGASPKPTVEWQDSAGNKLPAEEPRVSERGGGYDIILQTNVTKTDNYSCVSTQGEIYHQINAEISVLINGSTAEARWVVPVSVVAVTFVFLVLLLLIVMCRNSQNDSASPPETSTPLQDHNP